MNNIEAYIEKLKQKPEHVRKGYAFWTSLGVTMTIFVFWLGSFSSWGVVSSPAVANAVDVVGSPSQSMIAGVGSFFGDVRDMIFKPKKITYSNIEVKANK